MRSDIIAAISTPPVASGVGLIRVSGEGCFDIAEKMFRCKTPVKDFEPYKMYVGSIDGGEITDFGMCVIFKSPKSYTGEDMVEFHCHGGVAITRAVLRKAISLGARLAERGEFTKRAFMNGKMSLSSAEGLVDMIYAQSVSEAKMGFYLYREKLLNRVKVVQDKLKYVLALIDANIDYPEEDIAFAETENVIRDLKECRSSLIPLIDSYKNSSKVASGVSVAICGAPNAGKSSLLNAILDCDKAIVTSQKGTTRDVVEGAKEIGGVLFKFYDTAGIRDSENEIERIGIEKSKKIISAADIILFVTDGAEETSAEDKEILLSLDGKNYVVVANKCDLPQRNGLKPDLTVSAATGENLDALFSLLSKKAEVDTINFEGDFLTEERHYTAISNAKAAIDAALDAIKVYPLDVVAADVKDGWSYLGQISGETCDEDVLNEIFSKFCVGK